MTQKTTIERNADGRSSTLDVIEAFSVHNFALASIVDEILARCNQTGSAFARPNPAALSDLLVHYEDGYDPDMKHERQLIRNAAQAMLRCLKHSDKNGWQNINTQVAVEGVLRNLKKGHALDAMNFLAMIVWHGQSDQMGERMKEAFAGPPPNLKPNTVYVTDSNGVPVEMVNTLTPAVDIIDEDDHAASLRKALGIESPTVSDITDAVQRANNRHPAPEKGEADGDA